MNVVDTECSSQRLTNFPPKKQYLKPATLGKKRSQNLNSIITLVQESFKTSSSKHSKKINLKAGTGRGP